MSWAQHRQILALVPQVGLASSKTSRFGENLLLGCHIPASQNLAALLGESFETTFETPRLTAEREEKATAKFRLLMRRVIAIFNSVSEIKPG